MRLSAQEVGEGGPEIKDSPDCKTHPEASLGYSAQSRSIETFFHLKNETDFHLKNIHRG